MSRQNYRSKLSSKNPYKLSTHRYLELKHFSLQYPEWEKELNEINLSTRAIQYKEKVQVSIKSTTEDTAVRRLILENKMNRVEETCKLADAELSNYIFEAVTKGKSYEYLYTVKQIPCSRGTFYSRYRKYFWLLSQE